MSSWGKAIRRYFVEGFSDPRGGKARLLSAAFAS
jgi:hypothetical protein